MYQVLRVAKCWEKRSSCVIKPREWRREDLVPRKVNMGWAGMILMHVGFVNYGPCHANFNAMRPIAGLGLGNCPRAFQHKKMCARNNEKSKSAGKVIFVHHKNTVRSQKYET